MSKLDHRAWSPCSQREACPGGVFQQVGGRWVSQPPWCCSHQVPVMLKSCSAGVEGLYLKEGEWGWKGGGGMIDSPYTQTDTHT